MAVLISKLGERYHSGVYTFHWHKFLIFRGAVKMLLSSDGYTQLCVIAASIQKKWIMLLIVVYTPCSHISWDIRGGKMILLPILQGYTTFVMIVLVN